MALSAAEQQFIIDKASEWLDSSFRSIDLFRPFQTFKPDHRQNYTMKDSRSQARCRPIIPTTSLWVNFSLAAG